MSMHRADYVAWAKAHPIPVTVVVTVIITAICAAIFWNAVL